MRVLFAFLLAGLISSCNTTDNADLLVHNATIYTVDSGFTVAEVMAIKDGKIVATGKLADIEKSMRLKKLNATKKTAEINQLLWGQIII